MFNRPWASQPQIPVLFDADNPINRGLAMLTHFGAGGMDARTGQKGSIEAGATINGTQYGKALRPGSAPAGYKPANVTDLSSFVSTTEYTLMLLVRVNSLGTRRFICADFSSGGIAESVNIEQNASNQWVTYHVNASNQWLGLSPNLAVTTGWHWVEIVFKQGSGFFGVVDDEVNASDVSGAASVARRAGADYRVGRPGAYPGLGFDGDIAFHGAWNRAVSNPERASIRANPWQLFAPLRRPWLTPAPSGAVTVFYPGSDIAAGGWTSSSGGSLYADIDDVILDRGDYITSPDLSTTATFGWKDSNGNPATIPAGTWNVDLDAAYFLGASGQVRLVWLDAGGSSVGATAWQTLTLTDTTYTLSITTTGPSTQFRYEDGP